MTIELKSLRGFFGFRGQTSIELSEILNAGVQLADLDRAPFHNKLGGVSSAEVVAVAAQFSYIGLQVPLLGFPTNMRAVCRFISFFANAANSQCRLGLVNNTNAVVAALTTVVAANSWDSQVESGSGVVIPPGARLVVGNSVTNVFSNTGSLILMAPNLLAGGGLMLDWVIAPGATLLLQQVTVNQTLDAGFYWDEYYLG